MAKNILTMSIEEIQSYIDQRKQNARELLKKNGAQWRREIDSYCLEKYGVSLVDVWTATDKAPKTREIPYPLGHPKFGEVYTYCGRGKLPNWAQGIEPRIIKVVK